MNGRDMMLCRRNALASYVNSATTMTVMCVVNAMWSVRHVTVSLLLIVHLANMGVTCKERMED